MSKENKMNKLINPIDIRQAITVSGSFKISLRSSGYLYNRLRGFRQSNFFGGVSKDRQWAIHTNRTQVGLRLCIKKIK